MFSRKLKGLIFLHLFAELVVHTINNLEDFLFSIFNNQQSDFLFICLHQWKFQNIILEVSVEWVGFGSDPIIFNQIIFFEFKLFSIQII